MYKGWVLAAADPGSSLTRGPLLHVVPSLSPFQHCSLTIIKAEKAPKKYFKKNNKKTKTSTWNDNTCNIRCQSKYDFGMSSRAAQKSKTKWRYDNLLSSKWGQLSLTEQLKQPQLFSVWLSSFPPTWVFQWGNFKGNSNQFIPTHGAPLHEISTCLGENYHTAQRSRSWDLCRYM